MVTIYGQPAFEYDSGSGYVLVQLPRCEVRPNIQESGATDVKESLDGTPEIFYRNYIPYEITVDCKAIKEADYLAIETFKRWAMQGGLFRCYPHYATGNPRPAFMPEYWEDCYLPQGTKFGINLTDGIAGFYDFSITFKSKTPVGGI